MMPHREEFFEKCRVFGDSRINTGRALESLEKHVPKADAVTSNDVVEWRAKRLAGGVSNNHVRRQTIDVRRYFRWMVKSGYIQSNPADSDSLPYIAAKKPIRFIFSEDQYRRVLAAAAVHKDDFWHPACVVAWGRDAD